MNADFFTKSKKNVVSSSRILYTPSSFAKESLLYLQEIGTLKALQSHINRRKDLDSCLFFMVKEGSGKLLYDGEEYPLKEGDCVFINCHKKYQHETDPENLWKLSWIHFYGAQVEAIYEKYVSRGGQPVFRPEQMEPYETLFDEIYQIASGNDYIKDMHLNAGLSELLVLVMKESWHPEENGGTVDKDSKKNAVLPIKEYLDEHYAEKISLDELANTFFISKFYMTRVFKEQFGVSINSYLLQIRITKAKQMLRFSDEKIEAIGYQCGFSTPNYFTTTFKNVEGITPSEYREKW